MSTATAADVAEGTAIVVASAAVHQLVAAAVPALDVRRVGSVADAWTALAAGGLGPPALVVLAQDTAESPDALAAALAYFAPRAAVVLLHRDEDLAALGERYLRVVAEHPEDCDADAPVEVVAEEPTGAELVTALRAALPARVPVLDPPPGPARPLRSTADVPAIEGAGDDSEDAAAQEPSVAAAPSRIVAVVSAKGGAGKSTTAVMLAATLARAVPGRRVCLVDLDVRDGQVATMLDLAAPTVATLCRDSDGITDATVLAHLAPHDRLGVDVLLAPQRGDDAGRLTGSFYRQVLEVLRRHYDVIVLDCPVTYRDPLLAGMALVDADRIVAVTTLAMTSLTGLRRMLHTLLDPAEQNGLGVPRETVAVAVNGALNGVAVERSDVADHTLGLPVAAVVPHAARDVLIATNRQRLDLLLDHPDLAPAYRDLAAWSAGDANPAAHCVKQVSVA